ncbi:AMP-binding protein [Desulfohalovibrio reitneri]|uniref:AMP-binding protein n=1 Tax=Desulfohalovibrio reitneri TaxID=1307759 RepID=UPI0004A7703B|nr:AMP-binding protein [Desulfohalovibrio reitneri]
MTDKRTLSIAKGERRGYPLDKTLHRLFREQAARTPHAPAVADGAERLTCAQLDRDSDLVAGWLIERGAGPGAIVALHMEESAAFMADYLGALKAGAAYMPLDTDLPPAARDRTLEAVQPLAV